MPKTFIRAQDLLDDSYELAHKVFLSDFKPNWLVALWRGGTPIGIAVHEYFKYLGLKTDHISIRTSSYEGKEQKEIRIYGLSYIIENATADDRLLLVDDIFDSGRSIQAVITKLSETMKRNLPLIKVATVYYKPANNKTNITPDFYIHTTTDWVVFPHEIEDMTIKEVATHKSERLADMLFEDMEKW